MHEIATSFLFKACTIVITARGVRLHLEVSVTSFFDVSSETESMMCIQKPTAHRM